MAADFPPAGLITGFEQMSKALIIAEKPSVAADLARALGRFEKKDDYFENDKMIISSAIGHLVELCVPSELDKKRGKWSFANLPIIPEEFELKPIEKTETRFKLLKRLLKNPDVTEIVNACDAGREGELIFRFLIKLSGVQKPIRRLWLQSMTPEAIRNAFDHLRTDEEMIPLAKAAFSRAESDWLVGINATRALTAFNSKGGGFQLTPVGRVQTPTLAILAEREDKIRRFKPRDYCEVHADFRVPAGDYHGRWVDLSFRRGADEDGRAERIWEREKADAILKKCAGLPGVVTSEEKKPTSQLPPLLFDLTSLQREANGRFSFSARRTLQLAQRLYEHHKVLTYPRTDSRYLPEDNLSTVKTTLRDLPDPALAEHAANALRQGWVRLNRRVFDNAKVSDHSAIIPTGMAPHGLDADLQKIYDLVARRFVAVFFPPAQFEITTRITEIAGEPFKTEGRVIKDPGWMVIYGRQATTEAGTEEQLVAAAEGQETTTLTLEIRENVTKPPPRFNEATLLSAMEGAGKLLEDEELRSAMSAKGLGTPATRAAIIEGLLHDAYLSRQGRELFPTPKGLSLITLLRGIGVSSLCSPEMTGEWEAKLKQMEHGNLQRKDFMKEIREMTREIVERAKNFEGDSVAGDFGELEVRCPKCGGNSLKEEYRVYRCPTCDYVVWKTLASRQFDPEEIKVLLTEGRVGPLEGFRSKMGRPFTATLKLGEDKKPGFDFGNGNSANGQSGDGAVDFSTRTPLHECVVCGKGKVYELDNAYICDQSVAGGKCTFRMGKNILQQPIAPAQVVKLMDDGKTELLTKFISKKGKPFSAFLQLKAGKVGFEFPPKQSKPGGRSRKIPAKASSTATVRDENLEPVPKS